MARVSRLRVAAHSPKDLASDFVCLTFRVCALRRAGALPIRAIALFLLTDAIEILVAALGVHFIFGSVPRLNNVKALAKVFSFCGHSGPSFCGFYRIEGG